MKQAEQKIKELFGTKENFCDKQGHSYKDFARTMRLQEKRIRQVNEFLKPLGLFNETLDEPLKNKIYDAKIEVLNSVSEYLPVDICMQALIMFKKELNQ